MANVRFYFGTQAKYDALVEKNPIALYFIEDTKRLYKGEVLMATGAEASNLVSGLMSAEDKIKLDNIVETTLAGFSPVDGSIVIADGQDGGKTIGVAISTQEGNALTLVDGGLFVSVAEEVSVPEYAMEKQTSADEGYAVSYKLKKTVNGESTYVGDTINIAKDMVLQGATLETVSEVGVPYEGAVVGDPYIDMSFNDAAKTHIYIPVKGLVDTYTAGDGIEIVDSKVSVKLGSVTSGLHFVDGALNLALATAEQDGAMSKEDKKFIDSIPSTYATIDRVKNTAVQVKYEISDTPAGTLVNYSEKEIRIMCPENAEFVKQQVGEGGDANSYYMTFKTYVPSDAVAGYIETLNGQADPEILNSFSTDEYGRRYQPTWLALAKYDETTGAWNYYGNSSSEDKYIGWDYQIDWYDANGVMIASDSIRINLSNKDCHSAITPYYVSALEAKVETMSESYTWGEL